MRVFLQHILSSYPDIGILGLGDDGSCEEQGSDCNKGLWADHFEEEAPARADMIVFPAWSRQTIGHAE